MIFKIFNFLSLFAVSLFNPVESHTNQVCTSTGGTGSTCGSAKFLLTTYHSCPSSGQTPGQLHIQTPTGDVQSFSFSSYCPMSGFRGPGPNGSPLSHQCSQELSNKCGNTGADVSCYYRPDNVNMVSAKGDETCLAGNSQSYQCAYYATIQNAVTGNYIVWTTGTDANLDPCTSGLNPTGKIPCDIGPNNKITLSLAIEGCGNPCSGNPPTPSGTDPNSQIPWTANVDLNSCSAAYDGIQCSVSCPAGFSQSGSIYCDDGNWVNSFACVDKNYLNYCHSASDCSGNGVTTDTNRQDGCDCTCNSGFIGTDCSVIVEVATDSPTKSPTDSPTKKPTDSPTKSPTDSPTKKPTDSPTKRPTDSPTKSPTDSPTKKPTDSPTKKPTDSPTKSPSNFPTKSPSKSPSKRPTDSPTKNPTKSPTTNPSNSPTKKPTDNPTHSPTKNPTHSPSTSPTDSPSNSPKVCASSSNDEDKGLKYVYGFVPIIIVLLIIICVLLWKIYKNRENIGEYQVEEETFTNEDENENINNNVINCNVPTSDIGLNYNELNDDELNNLSSTSPAPVVRETLI